MLFDDFKNIKQKKILIVDNLDNYNRLLKKYCVENKTNIANIKGVTLKDLALALFHSQNVIDNENFTIIDERISSEIIELLLRVEKGNNPNSEYVFDFIPKDSIDGATPFEILNSINQIRMGKIKDENDKYNSLSVLIERYTWFLENHNIYDYPYLLDYSINFIDENIDNKEFLRKVFSLGNNLKIEVIDYVIEKLTYKELLFLDKLKEVYDFEYEGINYLSYDKKVNEVFVRAYGIYNEVDYIRNEIIDKKIKFGDVEILYTDDIYENIIKAIFENNNISFRFKRSHANSTNLIQLFKDIISFYKSDFLYEKLYDIVKNPIFTLKNDESYDPIKAFNKVVRENICNTRKRYLDYIDRYQNDSNKDIKLSAFLNFLNDIINAYDETYSLSKLYLSIYELVKKYSYLNNEYISLKETLDDLEIYFDIMGELSSTYFDYLKYIEDVIDDLVYKEKVSNDSVLIEKLSSIKVIDRKNVFVIGLSSSQMKKKEVESAIFTDSEYEELLDNSYYIKLAKNNNKLYEEIINKTIDSVNIGNIHYIYMSHNTIDFKPSSPSVYYLDKLKERTEVSYSYDYNEDELKIDKSIIDGYVESIKKTKEDTVLNTNNVSNGELSDKIIDLDLKEDVVKFETDLKTEKITSWNMSASGLGSLVKCPMCYMYQYIKFLPKVSYKTINNYSWLDPLAKGNLFHHTLENYSNVVYKKDTYSKLSNNMNEFNKAYKDALDEAVKEIPYPSEHVYESEKEAMRNIIVSYIEKLEKFYDDERLNGIDYKNIKNELGFGPNEEDAKPIYKDSFVFVDKDKEYKTSYSISLNGSIDRLDGYLDGNTIHFKIIDYKTSKENNIKKEIEEYSKIQHYIYYMATVEYFNTKKDELESLFGSKINDFVIDDMEYHLIFEDFKELKWSESFSSKKLNEKLPGKDGPLLLPELVREALGIVSLMKDGVNIDILYKFLNEYYKKFGDKYDPNKYSDYKHICRYELSYKGDDIDDIKK